jgi:hypothetical protein
MAAPPPAHSPKRPPGELHSHKARRLRAAHRRVRCHLQQGGASSVSARNWSSRRLGTWGQAPAPRPASSHPVHLAGHALLGDHQRHGAAARLPRLLPKRRHLREVQTGRPGAGTSGVAGQQEGRASAAWPEAGAGAAAAPSAPRLARRTSACALHPAAGRPGQRSWASNGTAAERGCEAAAHRRLQRAGEGADDHDIHPRAHLSQVLAQRVRLRGEWQGQRGRRGTGGARRGRGRAPLPAPSPAR